MRSNNIAMKCWCLLWIIAVFCYKTNEASTTATPDNPCGTLAEISEKLWEADDHRYTFGDVESVFPDLTNFSDAAIADAIQLAPEESLPDIIVFLGAAKAGQNSGNSTKLFQFFKRKGYKNYVGSISNTFKPQPLHQEEELSAVTSIYTIQEFFNSVGWSNVMDEFSTYLNCKGYDYDNAYDYWGILFKFWFSGYSRYYAQCGEDSSGFEYTFVGEYTLEGSKVVGLHNWETLYWLERGNEMQYVSFNGLYEPNLLALSFTWNGREQSQGSVFLGTSLEFEIVIYTLCFLEMVGQDCTLSFGGHEITIRTFQFGYEKTVFEAYPVIPSYSYSPDPPRTLNYKLDVDCNPTTPPQPVTAYPVSTSPTTSTPPASTACDSLSEIAEKLWTADSNRMSFSDVPTSSSADIVLDFNTGTKLFQYVNESKFDYPVHNALLNIKDNYLEGIFFWDDILPDLEPVLDTALELLVATNPWTELIDYLTCKGHLTDQTDILGWIYRLWFSVIFLDIGEFFMTSCGFGYTFLGDISPYDGKVIGLHDWYRLYLLERDGQLNYTSFIGLSEPNLLEFSYTWGTNTYIWKRYVKEHGAVLLGSSIEFQMAIYTLCYMEMPGFLCPLTMGGRVVTLMTVDIYNGSIAKAYPVSTSLTKMTATTVTATPMTTIGATTSAATTTQTTTTTPTSTTTTTTSTQKTATTTTTPTPISATATTTTTTPTPTATTTTTKPTPTITTTITTTSPTPTTTTTTTSPTPTTTYHTTTPITTTTTTTPTHKPVRGTSTTVKTPTTTSTSPSPTGGILVLLMLQLVLHWLLQ